MRRVVWMPLFLSACTHQEDASPLAEAGPALSGEVGQEFTPDGSASAAESFTWQLAALPPGSALGVEDLHDADTPWPWFTPDAEGTYTLELLACGAAGCAVDQTVALVGAEAERAWLETAKPDLSAVGMGLGRGAYLKNKAPVAAARLLRFRSGNRLILDGAASYDPEGQALKYRWSFITLPAGSALTSADLNNSTSAQASFTPDVEGTYAVRLRVSDGLLSDSTTLSAADDHDPLDMVSDHGPLDLADDHDPLDLRGGHGLLGAASDHDPLD